MSIVSKNMQNLRKHSKSSRMYLGLSTMAIGCIFYCTGNFGFLNIFGIRREIQAILILFLLGLFPTVFKKISVSIKEPIFLLVVLFLLAELALRREFIDVIDLIVSVFVVAIVFSLDQKQGERVLKVIITIALFFSVTSIIEALILWVDPTLLQELSSAEISYTSSTGTEKIDIFHPIEYLGFISPGDMSILGRNFTRFRSFVSEPSAMVSTFLFPGLLALTFNDKIKFTAIPILFFSIVLVASGAIWLSVFIGMFMLCLFYVTNRNKHILTLAPYLLIIIALILLLRTDTMTVLDKYVQFRDRYSDDFAESQSMPFQKYGSLGLRYESAKESITLLKNYPFGTPFRKNSSEGLLFVFLYQAGVIGLFIGLAVVVKIFKYLNLSIVKNWNVVRISLFLLYGSFMQTLIFSGHGWAGLNGTLMLSLTIIRLRALSMNKEHSPLSIGI